jgi:hypothetical protein
MKNFKITRSAVITAWIIIGIMLTFLTCWLFSETKIFNDTLVKTEYHGTEVSFGWVHIGINIILVIIDVVWLIYLIWEISDDSPPFKSLYDENYRRKNSWRDTSNKEEEQPSKPIRWKRWIWLLITLILVINIFKFGKTIYKQSVFLYNTSKIYHNTYQQKLEEKLGFYDKLWKTYQTKAQIANMNKDVFVEVTKIIMSNVADGEKVTWKWISKYPENIDYDQFTAFYADLSTYIAKEREGYFSIEKACQLIANKNNTMLDTFPNNIYNRTLKLQKINFQYGFLSDSTNHVFASKVENLK